MAPLGGASIQDDLVRGIIGEVKLLTVERLKRVLRSESQLMSGIKTELQTRLIAHILDAERRNDQVQLRRIRDAVRGYPAGQPLGQHSQPANPYPSPYTTHTPASSASPQFYGSSPSQHYSSGTLVNSNMPPGSGFSASRVTFKDSPFYTVQKPISTLYELKAREQTRDAARLTVTLDEETAYRMSKDQTLRAFVFCAADSYEASFKPSDIAFPTHAELKVNQEDVKVNLKGLKNKPGSTRPVDITSFMRRKSGFPNTVELVYALTNKGAISQKYYLLVNLVQKRSISSLVDELKRGKYLSRDRVIRDMQNRAKDDDIVTLTTNMTLKDPVQITRIETPCRSMACKHNECFDAAVFLALQEQAPTWTCPLCSKPAAWDTLVFDQFFQHILLNTPPDAEQVTVEPDGTWYLKPEPGDDRTSNSQTNGQGNGYHDADDDDVVEVTDLDGSNLAMRPRDSMSRMSIHTPPIGGSTGRDSSFTPSFTPSATSTSTPQPQSQSRKRPREEVIDLTSLSDDDDDEPPVSRVKRPSLSSQLSDSNNRALGGIRPFRFPLPPPPPQVPRTSSPADYYDLFGTRL